jgi:hypothetical protein
MLNFRPRQRPHRIKRIKSERESLPTLRSSLGCIGVQMGTAKAGVGRFKLGNDRYQVEAFGDAFAVWQPNGKPKIFWTLEAAVRWARIARRDAAGKIQ